MNIDGDDDEVIDTPDQDAGTESSVAKGTGDRDDGQAPAGAPEHPGDEKDDGPEEVLAGKDDAGAADDSKPLTRGQARFQRLSDEAKAAREEAAAARREAEELRRAQWQRDERVSAQEEAQRLALMTDSEQANYKIEKHRREIDQQRQQDRFQLQSLLDKTAYDAKATVDPIYAKHSEAIEAKFQEQMRAGRPVDRETILKVHLGELALTGARNGGAARRQARQRVESQRVASGSGKGDASADRGKAGSTPESRLKDVFI